MGRLAVGVAVLLALAGPVRADEIGDAWAKLKAIGKKWDGRVNEQTQAIWLPLLAKADKAGVTVAKNLHYGPADTQVLDVYHPDAEGSKRPVVIFFHGGGLAGGDKDTANTRGLMYANVPTFFARNGMIGINANFRLVPGVTFPGGGEDVAAAVAWAKQHAAEYGGDPDAVFAIGNSAGGTHLATYLFNKAVQPAEGPGLAGAILLSPPLAADTPSSPRANVSRVYYGEDSSKWPALAPLGLAKDYAGPLVPTFLMTAEFDPWNAEAGDIALLSLLCNRQQDCPRFTQVAHHNHLSTVLSLNTADDSVGAPILDFIRSVLDPRKPA